MTFQEELEAEAKNNTTASTSLFLMVNNFEQHTVLGTGVGAH